MGTDTTAGPTRNLFAELPEAVHRWLMVTAYDRHESMVRTLVKILEQERDNPRLPPPGPPEPEEPRRPRGRPRKEK